MTVVARHTVELELELEAPNVKSLDAVRAELARRLSHVIPLAIVRTPSGAFGRVIAAEVRSPGLAKPIRLGPLAGTQSTTREGVGD